MSITLKDLQLFIEHHTPPDRLELMENLATILYDSATREFLEQFELESFVALTRQALEFMDSREARTVGVRVYNPERSVHGWSSPHTAIEINVADRPFLVDSVRMRLRAEQLELYHLIHPIPAVERDAQGRIRQIFLGHSETAQPESYELFLVDRISEERRLRELEEAIRRILEDVVAATDDYGAMRLRCQELCRQLESLTAVAETPRAPEPAARLQEYEEFLKWLDADNFIFLGYREYRVVEREGRRFAEVVPGSGLGILRNHLRSRFAEPIPVEELPETMRRQMAGPPLLLVAKANSESHIHRASLMDYVGLKAFDDTGQLTAERRFLGLFTSKAHTTSVGEIPLLRGKLQKVMELARARRGSHDFKRIINIVNSVPLGELFLLEPEELYRDLREMMSIEAERGVRLQVRVDPFRRGLVVMVQMPKDRFNSEVRGRIQNLLAQRLQASQVDYHLAMAADDEDQVRFHFFFSTAVAYDSFDLARLEREVTELTLTWDDRLEEQLAAALGSEEGQELARRYGLLLSEGYKAEVPVEDAVRDILNLEQLGTDPLGLDLLNPPADRNRQPTTYLRLYHPGPLALNEVFPILENLGLQVLEQISYQLREPVDVPRSIDIFRVLDPRGQALDIEADGARLKDALASILSRQSRNDRLNRLVLTAGLSIREVALLCTYRGYLFQVMPATSLTFINDTLLNYPQCAARLVEYFRCRFDPARAEQRETRSEVARVDAIAALNQVATLPEDEIVRMLVSLVGATVRTNFYLDRPYISFKIESRKLERIPEPKPFFEIFVSAPEVEAVHLRGGRIARGGLRWSDRPDDYRTEVLGLMKTQMTKNALIVPVGSKGGFVLRNPPADRDRLREFVREQYKTFIRGMLDLTDNIVGGVATHPKGLVIYDDFDPYLVVAADKGTATFSDTANEISHEYGFWLGDAFASGGSHGYDHKKEGITARGAWECVKRHFRELGIDPHRDLFTVVGIGDMSGDVFGNGMLYTDRIRLLAAFNHLHIFVDPAPDPEASFRERRRLFEDSSSGWADYDPTVISRGGGVFPRQAKSIPLSPEMKALFETDADELSGRDLIRAILKLKVDLLWNGGIGTYVKASSQRNADVGDPGNDAVRIDANELRARVIGEGGNLGLTQLARIEYALLGGRINTDAIDNSGGVDMSDHEVNIKIALNPLVAAGDLTQEERNRLLREMTDEVTRLVLANNYSHALCLSLASRVGERGWTSLESMQHDLTATGQLKPEVEYLPDTKTLELRRRSGQGYTRPELAVLLAYAKMGFKRALLEGDLPDEPQLERYLFDYFPEELRTRFAEALQNHRLRREIIATRVTNLVIDRLGPAFPHEVIEETEALPAEALRAILAAHEILDLPALSARIIALDSQVAVEDQYDAFREVVASVRGIVHWLILGHEEWEDFNRLVETYRKPLGELRSGIGRLLPRSERRRYQTRQERFEAAGFPADLAAELAAADYLASGMSVVDIVRQTGRPMEAAARVFYAIGDLFSMGWLRDQLAQTGAADRWSAVAVGGLITDLRHVQRQLTVLSLRENPTQEVTLYQFLKRERRLVERITRSIAKMREQQRADLAAGSVVTRLLLQLLRNLERREIPAPV